MKFTILPYMNRMYFGGERGWMAADQIRGGSATCDLARFRKWRQILWADIPRAALAGSLALGYYRPPFQGFPFAASQTVGIAGRWIEKARSEIGAWFRGNLQKMPGASA